MHSNLECDLGRVLEKSSKFFLSNDYEKFASCLPITNLIIIDRV